MFRWLRTGNPYTFIYLLLYALVIKFYYLAHPVDPVLSPLSDGLVYKSLVQGLQDAGLEATGFTILAFVLLVIEAMALNMQVNRFRILPGTSFFTAFCFLLFSSFFFSWNAFSAPLVTGLAILLLIHQLFKLYETKRPRTTAFNLGLIVGLSSLFYLPAIALLVLVWFALLNARPFRPAEWILVLLGVLCPYYFIATILFLAGRLSLFSAIPLPGFSMPELNYSYWILGGMIGLLSYFVYGSIRLQQVYIKMLIHIRKAWIILLAFLIIALVLPFLPDAFQIDGWLIAFLPMSVFIACGFWHVKKKWFAWVLHLLALGFIFILQWVH